MINIFYRDEYAQIPTLDAALAEVIDTYKSLKPKQDETAVDPNMKADLDELRVANEKLKDELLITKNTMSDMIAEFGNMFGGGKDHELAKHEVVEKVESSSEDVIDNEDAA